MKRTQSFLSVSSDQARVRHQQSRRKVSALKTKQQQKKKNPSIQPPLNIPEPYPTPSSSREDVSDESEVEEVVQCHPPATSPPDNRKPRKVSPDPGPGALRLYHGTDTKKESIHDLFSPTGNLDMPYYYATYTSKESGVPEILNYYLQVAGPTAIWRPQLVDGNAEGFMRSFFQLSMKEPLMFEAVVAISQAHLDLSQSPGSQPSTAVLQHRGKVLRMLQASLVSSTRTEVTDTDLMAVFCMLVLDIMYRDWNSVEANMQGFRNIAGLRGGIDNLGWHGWFRTCFSWAELRWAGHISRASSTTKSQAGLELPTYPSHPFNPTTCLSISRLPEGLREAALKMQLSNEVIAFLEQVQAWTIGPHLSCAEAWTRQPLASFSRSRADYLRSLRITLSGSDILGTYVLKPSERLLCIGVLAYIIAADGSVDDGLEDHMVDIKAVCEEITLCEHLLWAGLAIAASIDGKVAPLMHHWVLLDHVMELDTCNDLSQWKDVKPVLQKYFWNPFIEPLWERCWRAAIARKLDRKKRMRSLDAVS